MLDDEPDINSAISLHPPPPPHPHANICTWRRAKLRAYTPGQSQEISKVMAAECFMYIFLQMREHGKQQTQWQPCLFSSPITRLKVIVTISYNTLTWDIENNWGFASLRITFVRITKQITTVKQFDTKDNNKWHHGLEDFSFLVKRTV